MAVIDRFIRLVRDLPRGEQGMALPVALFAMISSMALAGAAVVATVDVQTGAHRDDSSKQAIAAADAGANIARARQTHYAFILNRLNPCLVVGTGGKLEKTGTEMVGGQEWCPEITGTVGANSYAYRVSPVGLECGSYELCVVSTGTADEVSRRIEVTYNRSGLVNNKTERIASEERHATEQLERELKEAEDRQETEHQQQLEEELQTQKEEESRRIGLEGFIGREGINLEGNANIRVGLGTNGNLVSSGNASICGNVRHGVGKTWTKSGNASQCSGYEVTEGNVELPPVSSFIPTDIATDNSDARITTCTSANVPANCQKDSYTGSWTQRPPFDPTTRAITLSSNDTLTVGGGDYWICSLNMSGNSQLIMADGATVRFFFDTPENCGNNANQITLSGNNRIAATGYQPSDGQYEVPGFYLLGSPTAPSQVNLSGNYSTTDEMIIYGPDTSINISGNATFKGIIAGKQINMSGNGTVEQDAGFEVPPELNPGAPEIEESAGEPEVNEEELPGETPEEYEERIHREEEERLEEEKGQTNRGAVYFTPQAYFECSGTTVAGSPPNADC